MLIIKTNIKIDILYLLSNLILRKLTLNFNRF